MRAKCSHAPGPDLLHLWPWHKRIVMNCMGIFVTPNVYSSTWWSHVSLKTEISFCIQNHECNSKVFTFVYVDTQCYSWGTIFLISFHPWCIFCKVLQINTLLQVNEFHKYNENTWGPSVIRDIYLTSTHSSHPVISGNNTANGNKQAHACWVCYFSTVRSTITKTLCSRISFKDFYMQVTFNPHEVRSI